MIENIPLPEVLSLAVSSESKEFAVIGKHAQPQRISLRRIIFGIIWLSFIFFVGSVFFGPLLHGEEIHFSSNGVSETAGPGNLGPIKVPLIIFSIFVIIGFALLVSGIYSLFKTGGYFVGTPSRLVHYKKNKLRSIAWEQFTGDIEVIGNERNGSLVLIMRTGRMVSSKNSTRYVPDTIYISGIQNVFEIEQICRKRIKENDPTSAINSK
jgi:hypothetical protein